MGIPRPSKTTKLNQSLNSTLPDFWGAFELGYTAQIDQWIEACQPGAAECGTVVMVVAS